MQIGLVGLGRMGMNMARRLMRGGHEVVAYNRSPGKVDQIVAEGAVGTSSLEELVGKLAPPRIVWIMLPAGGPVDAQIDALAGMLAPGDIIVDGGNSYYKDDIRHAESLAPRGIHYVDAGVSGGIWGLSIGYCTMLGGERADVERIEPLIATLAPKDGFLHCGPVGAGHFVKMVHNGIEYAMMQSYAEGFEILRAAPFEGKIKLADIANLWNQGSVVRSWLLELLASALKKDPELSGIKGYVEDSGEGRWTVQQAIETAVPATTLAHALFERFRSREGDAFADKVLAALRNEFGGHEIKKA